MGYVPPGSLRQAGEGDDLPRREHRRDRQPLRRQGALSDPSRVGELGERVAESFLLARGHLVVGRNVRVGRDEIDLLAAIGPARVIVEVKSALRHTKIDPADHLDSRKVRALRRAGRALVPPVYRIDLITVVFDDDGCDVCWTPRVA